MSETIRNLDVDEAVAELGAGAFLLDVRERDEWLAGHATLATHVALSEVPDRLDELPRDRTIVCVCRAGGRSARAAAFLAEQGFATANLEGGMQAWAAQHYPLSADGAEPRII
jgi:rhodanese-related sulfurtransferase